MKIHEMLEKLEAMLEEEDLQQKEKIMQLIGDVKDLVDIDHIEISDSDWE